MRLVANPAMAPDPAETSHHRRCRVYTGHHRCRRQYRRRVVVVLDAVPGRGDSCSNPDPHNAKQCWRSNAATSNITVFECAVGATDGRVALSNPDNKAWAVQTSRLDDDRQGITVRTLT